MSLRPVRRLIEAKPTLEGAGVRLRRAFGFGNTSEFDPFLLLDDGLVWSDRYEHPGAATARFRRTAGRDIPETTSVIVAGRLVEQLHGYHRIQTV